MSVSFRSSHVKWMVEPRFGKEVGNAIAEGKVKVTVADLDRLIRLEEFLREDVEKNQLEIIMWCSDEHGNPVREGDEDGASRAIPDKKG